MFELKKVFLTSIELLKDDVKEDGSHQYLYKVIFTGGNNGLNVSDKYLFYSSKSYDFKDNIGKIYNVNFDIKFDQSAKVGAKGKAYIVESMKVKLIGATLQK